MQAMVTSTTPAVWTVRTEKQGLPDPVRRPPGHPPQEPIIIKIPPRLPEAPEIDRSDDEEEEEAEIRTPPDIVPELPPPPRPEERAVRHAQGNALDRDHLLTRGRVAGTAQPDRLAGHGQLSAGRRSSMPALRKPGEATSTLRRDGPSSF